MDSRGYRSKGTLPHSAKRQATRPTLFSPQQTFRLIPHRPPPPVDIVYLIEHPEALNHETLYDLRKLVALQPTFHAARILMLRNLFLLHDPTFDQELRRAAILLPDRRVLFEMTQELHDAPRRSQTTTFVPSTPLDGHSDMETAQYTIGEAASAATAGEEAAVTANEPIPPTAPRRPRKKYAPQQDDTTSRLLNDFLETTPKALKKRHVKPNPTTDYMGFLMEAGGDAEAMTSQSTSETSATSRLDTLIDNFILASEEGIVLPLQPSAPEGILDDPDEESIEAEDTSAAAQIAGQLADAPRATEPEDANPQDIAEEESDDAEEDDTPTEGPAKVSAPAGGDLTEALAYVYIKQQKYERAAEVMTKLQQSNSGQHNPYLADQVRFLQKLALNERRRKAKE